MDVSNENNTKLQLTTEYGRHTSEIPPDADIESLLDIFVGLMVSATYSYKGVLEAMHEYSNEKLEVYFPEEREDYDDEEEEEEDNENTQYSVSGIGTTMRKMMEMSEKSNDAAIKSYFQNAITSYFETGRWIDTTID